MTEGRADDMRERLVRLEVTNENIKDDISEIKEMFRSHTTAEELSMDKISGQIADIGKSHEVLQASLAGRIWGMRAAWLAIIAVGGALIKFMQFGNHS